MSQCSPTVSFVLVFTLFTVDGITSQIDNKIAPMTIADNGAACTGCSSEADWNHDARQTIKDFIQNYININGPAFQIRQNCGPGNWQRVFYLNYSGVDQESNCPGNWNVVTIASVRGCSGVSSSCASAFSDAVTSSYTKVCGRVIARGTRTPDAFFRYIQGQNTTEHNYVDGVSITHGATGSREHVWTVGVSGGGHPNGARCPCDNTNNTRGQLPPHAVGENYFCVTSDGGNIWTGKGCTAGNPCCSFHNPVYFSVQLPKATTDTIILRCEYVVIKNMLMSLSPLFLLSCMYSEEFASSLGQEL